MSARLRVLSAVFADPGLVRLLLAYATFAFGEWSTWVAVIVYAYGRGGAAEAGVVVFVELAPAVVLAPTVAGLGDRYPRARVLFGTYAGQAVLMGLTAAALGLDAPALVVYALATVTATTVALSRPVHASLLPEVVSTPDQLTAANVLTGILESGGSLLGPLCAGLLIAIGGPEAVFIVAAVGSTVASIAIAGIARSARSLAITGPAPGRGDAPPRPSRIAVVLGGLAAIRADRHLASVVAIATCATFLVGALDILYAVLAIDILDLGPSAVGYLGAAGGIGATIGAAAALSLVGRERLGIALGASCLLYGIPIAAVAVTPGTVAAASLLVAAGIGSGLTAVAAQTLIQRLAGDDVMSRVFGTLQGLMMGSTAIGALAVPLLVGLVGDRTAFAIAGLSMPIAFILLGRAIRAADRLDPTRARDLRLLRGVSMLGPLSAPVLERLASSAVHLDVATGTAVIRAGEPGDRFYVVD